MNCRLSVAGDRSRPCSDTGRRRDEDPPRDVRPATTPHHDQHGPGVPAAGTRRPAPMPATMIDLQYRLARALYDVVLGDAEDWDQTWEDAYRAERASIIASMPAE